MFLHYLTLHKKLKRDIDELNQSLIDIWDRILQGIIDKAIDQCQNTAACTCEDKGMSLRTPTGSRHTTSFSRSPFRPSKTDPL